MTSGLDSAALTDPARALAIIGGLGGRWSFIGALFAVATGLGIVFSIGVWARLREKAPTRAYVLLSFSILGLAMHTLASLIL